MFSGIKDAGRANSRAQSSRGLLVHFTADNFVLMARVRKSGPQVKLVNCWMRPLRVVPDER